MIDAWSCRDPEEAYLRAESVARLRGVIRRLTGKDAIIANALIEDSYNVRILAERLCVSKSRVSILKDRLLGKLLKELTRPVTAEELRMRMVPTPPVVPTPPAAKALLSGQELVALFRAAMLTAPKTHRRTT